MAALAQTLDLGPDQFAFHFETDSGVGADALATFLQRASTVARRQGGELRVIALRDGSLSVIIEAIKKSKLAKNAKNEFEEKPIEKTIAISGFTAGIVWAIVTAMSPAKSGDTPINKSGADIVEKCAVTQISVVTNQSQTVVMDEGIARAVREAEAQRHQHHSRRRLGSEPMMAIEGPRQSLPDYHAADEHARHGKLIGKVILADDRLFFGPNEYRFLVPIDVTNGGDMQALKPGEHYQVVGEIKFVQGQPDSIVIEAARPVAKY